MRKILQFALPLFLAISCCNKSVFAQYIIKIAGKDTLNVIGGGGDGGSALNATLYSPQSICRDAAGNLYIGDGANSGKNDKCIRKIDANTGIITTIAGGLFLPSSACCTSNVPATSARLIGVFGLCIDKQGNLLIADGRCRLWKLNLSTGYLTIIAGTDSLAGNSGDGGPATAAQLRLAADVAVDKANNIYIADSYTIRKINAATGIITRYAGVSIAGYSGDGGPAIEAELNGACGICIDTADNLYIADNGNNRVRKVNPVTGIITTVAGGFPAGFGGDEGPATAALLHQINRVAVDRPGNLYITDAYNQRIRRIDAVSGIISTYAGNGLYYWGADTMGDNGPAIGARVMADALCFDTCGNMYIGSRLRHIRAVVTTIPPSGKICGYTINATPTITATPPGELKIYTNPNDGQFSVHLSANTNEPIQITITDITGRKIKEISSSTNKDTPVQLNTPPGMYFITLSSNIGKWCRKVVVE